jgi:predicted RNA binding protein YcfA (HicA-like mRNA interferase family)
VKLPRDLAGAELVKALSRLGYRPTRQTGSHVRLTIQARRESHLTVPLLKPLPVGTLSAVLKEAAMQLEIEVGELVKRIL